MACLAASSLAGCALLLAGLSRARLELGRLRQLHADQRGSAQSLSFVLTLPLFIMVLLFIVQVSQLMIGKVVVEYAAYGGGAGGGGVDSRRSVRGEDPTGRGQSRRSAAIPVDPGRPPAPPAE